MSKRLTDTQQKEAVLKYLESRVCSYGDVNDSETATVSIALSDETTMYFKVSRRNVGEKLESIFVSHPRIQTSKLGDDWDQ